MSLSGERPAEAASRCITSCANTPWSTCRRLRGKTGTCSSLGVRPSTPKGTIWRQADIAVSSLGAAQDNLQEYDSLGHFTRDVAARAPQRLLSGAPLMHGLGQWNCLRSLNQGLTVVLPPHTSSFRPDDVVATCIDQRVTRLVIAGDAFALPLVEYLSARVRAAGREHDRVGQRPLVGSVKGA